MNLQSWNRFNSHALQVAPNVMGQLHCFNFGGASIAIALPSAERTKDASPGRDEVAVVRSKWAATGEPINYQVLKVDVLTQLGCSIDLPLEVLAQNANAYDAVSNEKQRQLESELKKHGAVARRAFEYWLSLIQWVTGDHRVGRRRYASGQAGWSTKMQEVESGKTVWIESVGFSVPAFHTLTMEQWRAVDTKLKSSAETPIYKLLKFEAEHFFDLGDFRRSLMDTAIACETYLRTTVLATLPEELAQCARIQIDEASIFQYINHLFPEIFDDATRAKYKKLKPELKSLFSKRNDLFHRGDSSAATAANCRLFLGRLNDLFALNT